MTNQPALDRFLEIKMEIDAALARLTALSDDHFNVSPDEVNWGHVGDLARHLSKLREVTDAAFAEGECA